MRGDIKEAVLGGVRLATLRAFRSEQEAIYRAARPASAKLADDARDGWVNGVPMQWMTDWPMPYPLFIEHGAGSRTPPSTASLMSPRIRTAAPPG
jgi:glutamate-1-semialdehyde 2,1-aminomutase